MSLEEWLHRREIGQHRNGDRDLIMRKVYKTMNMYDEWNDFNNKLDNVGAIFNLEFNADGNVLVAACEKRAVLIFDAITHQQTYKIPDAHSDNVNCIKFLNDRLFATGSDDDTVALWDLRYLKHKLRVLHGHSNWVKNIEYSPKDKLLVTSGFDGCIFTWDIKSQTEQGLISQKVFHTSGLMRCRISPDGEKLVLCTSGGYIMIVHHLDLTTLHKDLCGFRPSIYRLMQVGEQYIPQAAKFDHVFSKSQRKNRVELVADFPKEDDAEMIVALQIHPEGRCILSRNISCDEKSEWTCVHDIHEEPIENDEILHEPLTKRKRCNLDGTIEEPTEHVSEGEVSYLNEDNRVRSLARRHWRQSLARRYTLARPQSNSTQSIAQRNSTSSLQPPTQNTTRQESFVPDIWAAEVTVQERAIRQNRQRNSNAVTGYNSVYAISSGVLPMRVQGGLWPHTRSSTYPNSSDNESRIQERSSPSDSGSSSSSSTSSSSATSNATGDAQQMPSLSERIRLFSRLPRSFSLEHQIPKNAKKLMYYAQEPNQDRGFIKEPCFSADGRIVCSPYCRGIRLLAYNPNCSDYPRPHNQLFDDVKSKPMPLVEIANISEHKDIVLCTKFSPREPILVSGCQGGRVIWYHPNL